jgi:predicted GIY-YIG superfamily endonuclease
MDKQSIILYILRDKNKNSFYKGHQPSLVEMICTHKLGKSASTSETKVIDICSSTTNLLQKNFFKTMQSKVDEMLSDSLLCICISTNLSSFLVLFSVPSEKTLS